MKKFNRFISVTVAALAVAAVCGAGLLSRAEANGNAKEACHHGDGDSDDIAQLDQLLADFHGALSYGGDINEMSELWSDDSTITLNGVSHVGKTAVLSFFTSSGYYLNNWVSLAPEFKTTISVHGRTAEASTQCVATDISVSPPVVRGVTQVNATMEKRDGAWIFTSMNNTAPAPL